MSHHLAPEAQLKRAPVSPWSPRASQVGRNNGLVELSLGNNAKVPSPLSDEAIDATLATSAPAGPGILEDPELLGLLDRPLGRLPRLLQLAPVG